VTDVALLTSTYTLEEARRNLPQVDQQQRLEVLVDRIEVVGQPPVDPSLNSHGLPAKDLPPAPTGVAEIRPQLAEGTLHRQRERGDRISTEIYFHLYLTEPPASRELRGSGGSPIRIRGGPRDAG